MNAYANNISAAAIRRYSLFVADLPCAWCGVEGHTQVAHYNGLRNETTGNGMGKKSHWLYVMPLCCARPEVKGCHATMDQHELFYEFEDRFVRKISDSEEQLNMVMETIRAAVDCGVLSP